MTDSIAACRLHVLLAKNADIGIVFRRGPAAWWHILKWDLTNFTFENGAWLKGTLYPTRSAVSHDGKVIAYFAMHGGWGTYFALSKPPWLKALCAWKTSGENFNPGPNVVIELSKSSPQDPNLVLNKYSEFGSCLYSITYPDSEEILLSDAIWADFDRKGRLVIASAAGELRICEINDSNLTTVFSNNLNSLKPTPVQAPECAKKW